MASSSPPSSDEFELDPVFLNSRRSGCHLQPLVSVLHLGRPRFLHDGLRPGHCSRKRANHLWHSDLDLLQILRARQIPAVIDDG